MFIRLDYQPLFGKGARAPPPNWAVLLGDARPDTRERRKTSLDVYPKKRESFVYNSTLNTLHTETCCITN